MNGGRIKKNNDYSCGRGYAGYHITWDNKKVFCRSSREKLLCLFLDDIKVYYLFEKIIYNINNINYKPDVFIYKDKDYTELESIIEVKGSYEELNKYYSLFKEYIELLGINYYGTIVFYDFRQLKKWFPVHYQRLEDYKNNSKSYVMTGERNPRYGMHCTDETKAKLKITTTKNWQDENFRKKVADGMKYYWDDPNNRKKASISAYKRNFIKRKEREKEKTKEYGYRIITCCKVCGKIYTYRMKQKERKNKGSYLSFNKYCNFNCQYKITSRPKQIKMSDVTKRNGFKKSLIKLAIKIKDFNINKIPEYKDSGILYFKSPLTNKTIKKYFNTNEEFYKELNKWQNC